MSCVALEASLGALAVEQAEEFRQEGEQYTMLSGWSWPTPIRLCCALGRWPTRVHHSRSIGSATARRRRRCPVLPQIVLRYQVLGDLIVVQAADVIRT
jgi:hypothetical protein